MERVWIWGEGEDEETESGQDGQVMGSGAWKREQSSASTGGCSSLSHIPTLCPGPTTTTLVLLDLRRSPAK